LFLFCCENTTEIHKQKKDFYFFIYLNYSTTLFKELEHVAELIHAKRKLNDLLLQFLLYVAKMVYFYTQTLKK
jgi:hypothetical protein